VSAIFRFDPDEVAVVTGGTTGIGLALSKLLRSEGVTVVVMHLPSSQAPPGLDATFIPCDIRDEVAVSTAFSTIVHEYGRLDMLANVAALVGLAVDAPLLEHSTELFRAVLETNLTAQFTVIRECARRMIEYGSTGRIVNVASIRGHLGGERIASYVASKTGLIGLTRAAALELAPHNIRVNAVAPGFIASEIALAEEQHTLPSRFNKEIPIAKFGQPIDAARVIAALLSADSNFVTGSVWDVDGGARAY
jgi:NAD(P)-dependent dehydrogenase (short-subunit alcohol dehydrogenase family)